MKTIRIIGVPMDLGQSHRGVDMGPSAIRYAGLSKALRKLGYETKISDDIRVASHYSLADTSFVQRVSPIAAACLEVYKRGAKAIEDGEIPIFLGGDHSVAIGSIGGVTHHGDCGLIWVDAHGDFNTPESTLSGNVHGMALSTLLGIGAPELVNVGRNGAKIASENVVLVGLRDVDIKEKELLKDSNITVYTMRDIDELGIGRVMNLILEKFSQLPKIHVSFDMDVMETTEAPGVGTPVPGGLTYREGELLMEIISESGKLQSLDIMEINPILDIQNRTAETAVALASSLFGKTIL